MKLVFSDWRRWNGSRDVSVYNTEEGVDLSMGALHSGSTFRAVIELDDDDAATLASAMNTGARPVFYAVPDGPCVLKRKPRKYISGPLATGRRVKR